jgi:integrase
MDLLIQKVADRMGEKRGAGHWIENLTSEVVSWPGAGQTKRNKNRVIPMNSVLYEALQGLRVEANGSSYVYPRKHVEGVFKSVRKKAGLQGLRLHDLRHTFATRLIHAGVDVFTVQKILGHSTITMTMRYVHSFEAQMRDAVAKLEEKFAQSLHNFPAGSSPAPKEARLSQAGSMN